MISNSSSLVQWLLVVLCAGGLLWVAAEEARAAPGDCTSVVTSQDMQLHCSGICLEPQAGDCTATTYNNILVAEFKWDPTIQPSGQWVYDKTVTTSWTTCECPGSMGPCCDVGVSGNNKISVWFDSSCRPSDGCDTGAVCNPVGHPIVGAECEETNLWPPDPQ